MKKYLFIFVILFSAYSSFAQLLYKEPDWVKKSQDFLQKYYAKDFETCYAQFDTLVQQKFSREQFNQAYESTIQRYGALKDFGATDMHSQGDYIVTTTTINHEKGKFNIQITFSKNEKIVGFFFRPIQEPVKSTPAPVYADASKFIEKDVKFGNEPFVLDAKLTLPKGNSKFPLLILVHGSGPNDMDEQIGPNKPFRDIAQGLASNGVAVLRYNKRTYQYNSAVAEIKDIITLDQEVLEDVEYAVNFAKTLDGINPQKIFVLGHSLGGLAIPQIAKENPDVAGFVIMAGANQPLEEKILEQYEYISKLPNNQGITEKVIADLKKQVERVKKGDFTETEDGKLPLGLSAAYWNYLKKYKPLEIIQTINKPFFVIQGQRDYQVTVSEFESWKKALKNNTKAHFQLYPKLNHLFLEGDSQSVPEEYEKPANIPLYVIKDISNWILEN